MIIYISVKCKLIPTTLHWWSKHQHDHERKYGKVDTDTEYPDVNDDSVKSSDIAKTLETIKYDGETVNSLSVDKKDINKLGDIVAMFTSSSTRILFSKGRTGIFSW